MLTKRITKGTYVGTNEEFIIIDDYADPNCAHRVLANAWIGTTLIHEELDDKEGEDPAERDELEIASPHFAKSLFSLSERREPDCGTSRRRLQKTASPHHVGEETVALMGQVNRRAVFLEARHLPVLGRGGACIPFDPQEQEPYPIARAVSSTAARARALFRGSRSWSRGSTRQALMIGGKKAYQTCLDAQRLLGGWTMLWGTDRHRVTR